MTKGELKAEASRLGLDYATWSPGDGVTRHRFYRLVPGKPADYFQGSHLTTCLGTKEALRWLSGFETGQHLAREDRS